MRRITRSYRIRSYPNGAQRRLRDRWFGAYRWLWNTALEIRTAAYRECDLKLTGNDISRWLTQWKGTQGHEWLKVVPATCLAQCLRDQDAAFRNFFAGRAEYPKFKRKGSAGSLRFQGAGTGWQRGILSLPKLGVLKLAESLPSIDRPDLVTLTLDAAGRYFVSFCAEVEKATPSFSCWAPAVGVDLGLKHLATLSTGEKIDNPKHYQARLRYLRQQQRCLSRRQKGSRRRERQKLRVARAHANVKQSRQYALHDLTTRLTQDYDLIFIEDLNVKALSRGRNARSINDAAFGEIRRQLTYKSEWHDKILIAVDRWYASSKTCSKCRHVLDELRLDVRYWTCPKCKASHDRDINAARNLLMEGLRQLAARDERDLRVDAGDACPEEILVQVLADEARSGQRNRACLEQASLH
jgi:putative transposase